MNGGQSSHRHEVKSHCQVPQYSRKPHYVFTYDLPDVTNYTLVPNNGNPSFKEYVIPAKSIDEAAYSQNLKKLNVFLIPFSHVDPGYGLTFDSYYSSKSKYTLNNMVDKLEQYQDLTFQWAEVVFLERWWRDITEDTRERVRALVNGGRLEIVLGGWVMPDEAITHFEPVVDQLIEGHQWLRENFNITPRNGWVNDPFGYSNTFPYLWKKSGMENLVILRIHQAIKGTLMKKRSLEFIWKQLWSDEKGNSMFCHIMPYRGYWIGDVCGPNNQHICREYAFMHTNPIDKVVFVTEDNVAERSRILYEQYRVTAELYRKQENEDLFLPIFLGEDFSFESGQDFDLIYSNYQKLFKYMNSKQEWKINIKFATLNDYFSAMQTYHEMRNEYTFPSVAGDFFPYSDYQNDYWTGYFTTRPYIKRLSRVLQRTLKAADTFDVFTSVLAKGNEIQYPGDIVSKLLAESRRDLGIFLHHDGITGTSVLPVIQDFHARLERAMMMASTALETIVAYSMAADKSDRVKMRYLNKEIGNEKRSVNTVTASSQGSVLIVGNPSVRRRHDVIHFTSKDANLHISIQNRPVPFQVRTSEHSSLFEISISYDFPPVSLMSFNIKSTEENVFANSKAKSGITEYAREKTKLIIIENDFLAVAFDDVNGMMTFIELKGDKPRKLAIDTQVLAYSSARSGAYIFAPTGPAERFLGEPQTIELHKGNLTSEVKVTYSTISLITKLYHVSGLKQKGVFISTVLDMSRSTETNKEVILRFKTDVNNIDKFYTDQNGFQLMGRKCYSDRPAEENYYPITTMILIEDASNRLTLHTAQPHGGSSLNNGWLEVMLDRKPTQDDGKGLGQGVFDNQPTKAEFVLQLERSDTKMKSIDENPRYTFPSESALIMNEILNQPLFTLTPTGDGLPLLHDFTAMKSELPCDVSIAGIRHFPQSKSNSEFSSILLRRWATHCDFNESPGSCNSVSGPVTLQNIFKDTEIQQATETSLTLINNLKPVKPNEDITPNSMELRMLKVKFK